MSVSWLQPPADSIAARRQHARRAVEVEVQPLVHAHAVLEQEVGVEHDRLRARQQRAFPVQVPPPRLHHAHGRVGEVRDQALEEVGGRNEVGVEHGDQLAARAREPVGERAGLEAVAAVAMVERDVDAAAARRLHRARRDRGRLVGGIVEHLDLEPPRRVAQRRAPPR